MHIVEVIRMRRQVDKLPIFSRIQQDRPGDQLACNLFTLTSKVEVVERALNVEWARATIQIKRKDTGKVEEYEIFGVPLQEQPKERSKEPEA